MNIDFFANKIIILKDGSKDSFLKIINDSDKLINFKIITLNELKEKYYFSYDERAIFFVMQKYNVIYEIAKLYLDNLYYVNKDISSKAKLLLNIKKDLEENNLLIKNKIFKDYFVNKKIILFDLDNVDNFYKNIFNELRKNNEVIIYENKDCKTIKDVYYLNNISDEISFVASEICKLIKLGIDINKIKIANVSNDYLYKVITIFKLFNIPFEIPKFENISGTIIVQRFKELFNNNIETTFEELKKYVRDSQDEKIYKSIINVVNNFYWSKDLEEVKDIIFNKVDQVKKDELLLTNAVRVIDFNTYISSKDEYIFLMNFNEGKFPIIYKDEDYLSDKEKELLGISSSIEKNKKEKEYLNNKISLLNNLIISYSKSNMGNELYISSLYNENVMTLKEGIISLNESDNYNLIKLLSNNDLYRKYGEVNTELTLLSNHYKDNKYMTYDNKYKIINKDKLYTHLNNRLSLSYTSMNNYYECSFKYYLNNILYLNKFEDSFEITIGNIFHKILSECFTDNYDFSKRYDEVVSECNYQFSISDKYFVKKLKKELEMIIETIKHQLTFTNLKKTLYEQEVVINVNEELNVTFKGFIDKVLYDEFDGDIIAVIVDYKTGTPKLNLDNAYYGLNLQLPVYVYLLKNSNIISNVKIGGFYLQKILNNSKTLEEKKKELKLQGYSNSNLKILENVDTSYMDSNIIKSLKYSNDKFGAYSKVLSDIEIDNINKLVSKKVNEASQKILNAEFDINPKEINQKLEGCNFCKFKDICYMKNEDIVKLDSVSKNDFLGGDYNA